MATPRAISPSIATSTPATLTAWIGSYAERSALRADLPSSDISFGSIPSKSAWISSSYLAMRSCTAFASLGTSIAWRTSRLMTFARLSMRWMSTDTGKSRWAVLSRYDPTCAIPDTPSHPTTHVISVTAVKPIAILPAVFRFLNQFMVRSPPCGKLSVVRGSVPEAPPEYPRRPRQERDVPHRAA